MRLKFELSRLPIVVAGMLAAGSIAACSHPNSYYDTAYNDYHPWNSSEQIAYRRWETDRQIAHVEYVQRSAEDQRAYWTWRHAHPDADRR